MKKNILRVLSLILSSLFVLQCLSGCATKEKTDDTIYLTKGEFFAYFVYEKNLTSNIHTPDEVKQCSDGSVEADILVEWGYLDEKNAKKDLNKPVNKETVVSVCAKSTFDMKTGNMSEIKDADMLSDAQLIADAYACGFFELENGYFDGAEKMTFASCEEIIKAAESYTANIHYDNYSKTPQMSDDVIVDDGEGYCDGDIEIDFSGLVEPNDSGSNESYTNSNLSVINPPKNDFVFLSNNNTNNKIITLANTDSKNLIYTNNLKEFRATITKNRFESKYKDIKVGDTVCIARYDVLDAFSLNFSYNKDTIVGILKEIQKIGDNYVCIFEYPNFEQAASKVDEPKIGASQIGDFVQEVSSYLGWKLSFIPSNDSVTIKAEKDFVNKESGQKQDWQNSKKTTTATVSYTISDFHIDVNNIKSFANKSGKGFIKITADTTMDFSFDGSLRYTPDDNRNGKFFSNFSRSRWTDSDAQGATEIKVARFRPSLYGIVGADIYIYLLIAVDGSISFTSSVDDGGIQIATNNGNISCEKISKSSEKTLNAEFNAHGKFGINASINLFGFINIIKYDVGLVDANATFVADLYLKNEKQEGGVLNTERNDLNNYMSQNTDFGYCIDFSLTIKLTGKLESSAVKIIVDWIAKGALDFETAPYFEFGFHIEDGHEVNACTRGNDHSKELEASKEDDIELSTYKVIVPMSACSFVDLKAIPTETKEFFNTTNSITVKSGNEKIAKAYFHKASKIIQIEAIGEGSTEIVITAKKGILWWKETVEQKISITVSSAGTNELTGVSYSFPSVNEYESLKVFAA